MNHRAILKAINRHIKKRRIMLDRGFPDYGVDFATWHCCYPQMASMFRHHAEKLMGRDGLFMPLPFVQ